MSRDVFRCDYCGQHESLDKARIHFVYAEFTTDDGEDVYTTGVYCSSFCASQTGSRVGGR